MKSKLTDLGWCYNLYSNVIVTDKRIECNQDKTLKIENQEVYRIVMSDLVKQKGKKISFHLEIVI